MSNVTAKTQIRDQVRKRVESDRCLIDGCEKTPAKRGLCNNHYQAFLRERDSRPNNERAEFETSAIRDGLILASGELREIKSPSPFANCG